MSQLAAPRQHPATRVEHLEQAALELEVAYGLSGGGASFELCGDRLDLVTCRPLKVGDQESPLHEETYRQGDPDPHRDCYRRRECGPRPDGAHDQGPVRESR